MKLTLAVHYDVRNHDKGSSQTTQKPTATQGCVMFPTVVTLSRLSLFQTVKAAPQADTANKRVSEAIETIKSLVSAQASPTNKQAASLIGGALIGDTGSTTVTRTPEEIRERIKAKFVDVEQARANWVEPEHATYESIRSIDQLSIAKHKYERGQQYIETYKNSISNIEDKLKTESDPVLIGLMQDGMKNTKKSIERIEDLMSRFDDLIAGFETLTRSRYNYSGQFLQKSEDGRYSWGDFSVTNRYTGEVAFENNGDGRVKRLDGIGGQPYFYTPLH